MFPWVETKKKCSERLSNLYQHSVILLWSEPEVWRLWSSTQWRRANTIWGWCRAKQAGRTVGSARLRPLSHSSSRVSLRVKLCDLIVRGSWESCELWGCLLNMSTEITLRWNKKGMRMYYRGVVEKKQKTVWGVHVSKYDACDIRGLQYNV